MIVGACGFGSTGSSVVSDYLMEFDNVCVLDGVEFELVSCCDGLIDLAYTLMTPHNRTGSAIAIKRFKEMVERNKAYYSTSGKIDENYFIERTNEFLDSLVAVKWKGFLNIERESRIKSILKTSILQRRVIPFIEKKRKERLECYPMEDICLSIAPDDFFEKSRKYVDDLLKAMGADNGKIIVLDQPFPGNNPQSCFPFFNDPYAIVVDRDPRDNYVFSKTKLLGKNHFMANKNVHDFITYYRTIRDSQPYQLQDSRVFRMQFEDFVYEYDKTTEKLNSFLGIGNNPHPKSVFDPSLSIANTQVFKRYPEFSDDIKIIERELGEYLFDFNKYPEPDSNQKMFSGKSPLHK